MLIINYGTGAGNDSAETLEQAMKIADQNAAYTQEAIAIEDEEGNGLMVRVWCGCLDGIEEEENPLRFGDYGYYSDWQEV